MTQTIYELETLVDITDTECSNPKGNTTEYKQHQNLNSLLQMLSMRAQLLSPKVTVKDDSETFGNNKTWTLTFACDISDAWTRGDDPVYFAKQDLNNIPVHVDLTETAVIEPEAFICTGERLNTHIKILQTV